MTAMLGAFLVAIWAFATNAVFLVDDIVEDDYAVPPGFCVPTNEWHPTFALYFDAERTASTTAQDLTSFIKGFMACYDLE